MTYRQMNRALGRCVGAAITAVNDPTLSPAQSVEEVVAQCAYWVSSSSERNDTSGLGDFSFCDAFWVEFLHLAKENAVVHDRLAQILRLLKARGTERCDTYERMWNYTSATNWEELPGFGLASREDFNGM